MRVTGMGGGLEELSFAPGTVSSLRIIMITKATRAQQICSTIRVCMCNPIGGFVFFPIIQTVRFRTGLVDASETSCFGL